MLFLRKLHKWLGLIIGLQLVLWAASGVMFAWLDRDDVDGANRLRTVEPAVLLPAIVKTEPATWIGDYPAAGSYDVRAVLLADRWAWRVELRDAWSWAVEDGTGEPGRRLATPPRARSLRRRRSDSSRRPCRRNRISRRARRARCGKRSSTIRNARRCTSPPTTGTSSLPGRILVVRFLLDAAHDGLHGPRQLQQPADHHDRHGGVVAVDFRSLWEFMIVWTAFGCAAFVSGTLLSRPTPVLAPVTYIMLSVNDGIDPARRSTIASSSVGTYWYHSHRFQEQVVVRASSSTRANATPPRHVLLSDWTDLDNLRTSHAPERLLQSRQRTADFRDARKGWRCRRPSLWGAMRMNPTDLPTSGYAYTYLTNGVTPAANWTGLFKGERVRCGSSTARR